MWGEDDVIEDFSTTVFQFLDSWDSNHNDTIINAAKWKKGIQILQEKEEKQTNIFNARDNLGDVFERRWQEMSILLSKISTKKQLKFHNEAAELLHNMRTGKTQEPGQMSKFLTKVFWSFLLESCEWRSEEKVVVVEQSPPEGGSIDIFGCKVIFPPGAVDKRLQFQLSVDINADTPEGYIPITPTLTYKPSMEFRVPVKVRLATWCSTESDQVMVEVIRQDDAASERQMVDLPLARANGVIEFKCDHLSSVCALTKRHLYSPLTFDVTASLFFHPCGNLSAVFHMDNPVVMKKTVKELEQQNFEPIHIRLNPLRIKEGEITGVMLRCHGAENYVLEPSNFQEFVVDEDFENNLRKYLTFKIDPIPQPMQQLQLRFSINDRQPVWHNLVWQTKDSLIRRLLDKSRMRREMDKQ